MEKTGRQKPATTNHKPPKQAPNTGSTSPQSGQKKTKKTNPDKTSIRNIQTYKCSELAALTSIQQVENPAHYISSPREFQVQANAVRSTEQGEVRCGAMDSCAALSFLNRARNPSKPPGAKEKAARASRSPKRAPLHAEPHN
jgi:hypothetical protein